MFELTKIAFAKNIKNSFKLTLMHFFGYVLILSCTVALELNVLTQNLPFFNVLKKCIDQFIAYAIKDKLIHVRSQFQCQSVFLT